MSGCLPGGERLMRDNGRIRKAAACLAEKATTSRTMAKWDYIARSARYSAR